MNALLITTDAYGCNGGIALYNRDLVLALSLNQVTEKVTVIQRNIVSESFEVQENVEIRKRGARGKFHFTVEVLSCLFARVDCVVCGHVNLLPLAYLFSTLRRVPLVLIVYGIDVWRAPDSSLLRLLVKRVTRVWTISEITKKKMQEWSGLSDTVYTLLPNAIHLERYAPGDKPEWLLQKYDLHGKTIIMTLGRLSSSERYKGVDEVLEVMSDLIQSNNGVMFLVVGDGDDKPRLEKKAELLGVGNNVIFTGFVKEDEKQDYFRLADAFVMPGRGEGFGFVFMEAMASGLPVVASSKDGSQEAVRNGALGLIVDPDNRQLLISAIIEVIKMPKKVPAGLEFFAFESFQKRVGEAIEKCILK